MDAEADRRLTSLRLIGPGLVGLAIVAFAAVIWRLEPSPMTPLAVTVILAQTYVIAEICGALLRRVERRRIARGAPPRLAVDLAAAAVAAVSYAIAVYVPLKSLLIARGERDAIGWPHLSLIALSALAVAVVMALAQFTLRYAARWRAAEAVAERHRRESLQAQLEALQAQINPHFLFNSLNALYGSIAEDPARAQALVLKLAEVFRYALRHAAAARVPLDQELAFLEAYLALLRARHGDGLVVHVDAGADPARWCLPPMTLQLLIENAVKHNALDPADPLVVQVTVVGDALRVENARKPRRGPVEGTGTGLANIRRRLALADPRPLEVQDDGAVFRVIVPLAEAAR